MQEASFLQMNRCGTFPAAQTLLEVLAQESQQLKLQIIVTTHSLTMIGHTFHSQGGRFTKLVFLKRKRFKLSTNL